jgi:hypothetical protein
MKATKATFPLIFCFLHKYFYSNTFNYVGSYLITNILITYTALCKPIKIRLAGRNIPLLIMES